MDESVREIRILVHRSGIVDVHGPKGHGSMRIVAGREKAGLAAGGRVGELVGEILAESPTDGPGASQPNPGPSGSPTPAPRGPYAYRSDAAVPAFPDDKPIIVFDDHCALCSGWVRFVVRQDRARRYRFVAAQSPTGQALYAHYGMDTVDFESNILLQDGVPWLRMEGTVRMAEGLGFPWTLAGIVRILPVRLQDGLYGLVARNRLRLFGRLDACMMPDPTEADRFVA